MVARPSGFTLRARVYKMQRVLMLQERHNDGPKHEEFCSLYLWTARLKVLTVSSPVVLSAGWQV